VATNPESSGDLDEPRHVLLERALATRSRSARIGPLLDERNGDREPAWGVVYVEQDGWLDSWRTP
jgi:hypothetical protein